MPMSKVLVQFVARITIYQVYISVVTVLKIHPDMTYIVLV